MTVSTPAQYDARPASDELLEVAVREALDAYSPTHSWGDGIQVTARAGAVLLAGAVRTRSAKETAEQVVRRVKGVTEVQNDLTVDAQIEVAIAQALAADTRTRDAFPGILVGVVFGVCYLKGVVPTAEVKSCAAEIASKIPGIRSVSDELQALSGVKTAPGKPGAAARPAA